MDTTARCLPLQMALSNYGMGMPVQLRKSNGMKCYTCTEWNIQPRGVFLYALLVLCCAGVPLGSSFRVFLGVLVFRMWIMCKARMKLDATPVFCERDSQLVVHRVDVFSRASSSPRS